MSPKVRAILVGIGGVVVANIVVTISHQISQRRFPFPEGLDKTDMEAMTAYIATLPTAAFVHVVVGWWCGAAAGMAVTFFAQRPRTPMRSIVPGIVIFLASVANSVMLPGPSWMMPAALGSQLALMAGVWFASSASAE